MMMLARTLLTPGERVPRDAIDFADGLAELETIPYSTEGSSVPVAKPPSLDADLWERIPNARRQEYLKKMAHGIRRGIHPDETAIELLAAA
ncbi:hypothetical protein ACQKGC_23830 [Allorhizobium pseudoryzae]|uniref:hypothetical protein n=1 Tax=Allorhizobium pseudoryzae TaxID=379684 RepID=UPI003CFE14C0